MSAARAIPFRLAASMCHAIGCLEPADGSAMCSRHWAMLSTKHQDACAQLEYGALREAMRVIAKRERRDGYR